MDLQRKTQIEYVKHYLRIWIRVKIKISDNQTKRIKELKAENKRLRERLKNYCSNCAHYGDWGRR